MGKKYPAHRPGPVQLTALYRSDRDEGIARAYQLSLPSISRPRPKRREEESSHEVIPPHRPLRTRL